MYCIIKVKKTLLKKINNIRIIIKKAKKMFIWISQQLTWLPTSHTRDLPGGKITNKKNIFYYIPDIFITFQISLITFQIFLITFQIFLSHSIYLLFHSKYFHYIPYISYYIPNNDENLRFNLFWLKCDSTEQRRNNCVPAQDS